MIKTLHLKQQQFQRKFTLFWIIATIFFLFSLLFCQWRYTHWQKNHTFQEAASRLASSLDEFIEQTLAKTYNLPFDNANFTSCQTFLLPLLQSIVFKNFYMSGIVISDENNKIICSTIQNNPPLSVPSHKSIILIGPLNFSHNNIYLLQQKLGKYYIGLYMKKPLFDLLMRKNGAEFHFIGFYDTNLKKLIFHFGIPYINNSWAIIPNDVQRLFNLIEKKHSDENDLVIPLHNLMNINLVIRNKPLDFDSDLLFNMLFMSVPFLLLSWLIYNYLLAIMNHRYSLTYALKNALNQNQFFPVYQPIRNDFKHEYDGAEVLIRWQSSTGEVIMPDYFIGEAEKSGLIVPITLHLVKKTFTECQHLLHKNRHFHLGFNLSLGHFNDNDFFQQFYSLCDKYAIAPSQIMLEITEREVFDHNELNIVDKLHELRSRGYSLALDDFGTGHASISYLQCFPFNYLKIDKLFIQAIGTGAITETLNLTIINMANSLNLQVIAEGVETKQQLDYLRQHQVQFVQGWYFSKAITYQKLIQLLQTTKD